jgi:cyclophilin family peptidyl-prolyl cis-trans isomerase/HEAT repeat protein
MRWLALILFCAVAAAPAHAQDPARSVRELGRQEQPALVPRILPLLAHTRTDVRREAANALGQALASVPRTGDTPAPPELNTVTQALQDRLRSETDAATRGVIAETLGRLPHRHPPSMRAVEQALRGMLRDPDAAAVAGAAKGLDALIRNTAKVQPPEAATLAQLRMAAAPAAPPDDPSRVLVRRFAWLALTAAGPVDLAFIERGYADPDLQVRRRALLALPAAEGTSAKRALLARALRDPAFQVRYEAVRLYNRTFQAEDCGPVLAAVDDANAHVSLAAIDALGSGCREAQARLVALTDALEPKAWHRGAHAIVSLARVARDAATPRLARFADHPDWQVRIYAARAAAALGAAARLERLSADVNDNVRHAAIDGLRQVKGHDADAIYIEALGRRDYQLVILAAQALEGTKTQGAIPALEKALTRIRAEKRDTSHDAQEALLVRLRELGWKGVGPSLPAPISPPVPGFSPASSRVRLTMSDGGVVEIRLLGDEAPAVSSRFVQLARQGFYNGLTFHRVVPNFVLQGGSPGANEYAGDGPFTRDEVGLRSNARGTIGLSTRGRNTGDMQFYVNLLDNPRLDHDFTVFGEITSGMDVMDRVLEGDVIARIDVLGSPPAPR